MEVQRDPLLAQEFLDLPQRKVGDHPVRLDLPILLVVEEVDGHPFGVSGDDPSVPPALGLGDTSPVEQAFGRDVPHDLMRLADTQHLADVIDRHVGRPWNSCT